MDDARLTEYVIQGMTTGGKTFRPGDWSERLAGAMSRVGPMSPGVRQVDIHLQYSRYIRPTIIGGLKCVVIDSRLRDFEPRAFNFIMNFARDNDLVVTMRDKATENPAPSTSAGTSVSPRSSSS